jgi:hypothetical protein
LVIVILRRSFEQFPYGARHATERGKAFAYSLATELAKRGVVVVSGMAEGIDSAAHRGALEAARKITNRSSRMGAVSSITQKWRSLLPDSSLSGYAPRRLARSPQYIRLSPLLTWLSIRDAYN